MPAAGPDEQHNAWQAAAWPLCVVKVECETTWCRYICTSHHVECCTGKSAGLLLRQINADALAEAKALHLEQTCDMLTACSLSRETPLTEAIPSHAPMPATAANSTRCSVQTTKTCMDACHWPFELFLPTPCSLACCHSHTCQYVSVC